VQKSCRSIYVKAITVVKRVEAPGIAGREQAMFRLAACWIMIISIQFSSDGCEATRQLNLILAPTHLRAFFPFLLPTPPHRYSADSQTLVSCNSARRSNASYLLNYWYVESVLSASLESLPLVAMDPLSRSEIIKKYPFEGGGYAFRDSFGLACANLGHQVSPNVVQQFSNERKIF
jgi:hypothetical protein